MNIAVILAGGTGTRLGGDIPKQYIEVEGKPVIGYCLDIFFSHPMVDAVQIVAEDHWMDYILRYIKNIGCATKENGDKRTEKDIDKSTEKKGNKSTQEKTAGITPDTISKWRGFSSPGLNRQLSIYNALKDCLNYASPADHVLIHDAARPLVSSACISACFEAVKSHDGVLPVLTMKDTVYFSEDKKRVSSLLRRESIFAGQAPEAFRLGKYYEANRALLPEKVRSVNGSTEPAILAGLDVLMIEGDEENFKITTAQDLERFRQKLTGQSRKNKISKP